MKTITIKDFSDFIFITFQNSFDIGIHRYRTSFVFRGLGNSEWGIQTSIQRHCGSLASKLEDSLLRNFKKYASNEIKSISGEDNLWKVLALGQHHGLPTRLLDWTYSPLVALHFATENVELNDMDGVVYMLDLKITKNRMPLQMSEIIDKENAFVFTDRMLNDNYLSLKNFDNMAQNDFLMIFEPPALDSRIVNQFGLFSVANGADKNINTLLEKYEVIKIIIPSDKKMEIRDYLDQMNINERILFPGLDGLSSWLQRHYKPYEVWEKQ